MAGKPVSGLGSGGMITKIEAGKIALGAGCNMVIASGHEMHPLKRILDGERCTGSWQPLPPSSRASAGSPERCSPSDISSWMTARRRHLPRARACFPPG